jgi:hypothetical protein
MVIESVEKTPTETYFYRFKKASGNASQYSMLNLLDIQINAGDQVLTSLARIESKYIDIGLRKLKLCCIVVLYQVILSIEQRNVGVATGTVIEITPTSILLELTSELQVLYQNNILSKSQERKKERSKEKTSFVLL